ncbi:MAG: hypothetical protein GY757_26595 [bacterium]|nr:hypothetical protein [bacterium]
MFEGFDYSAFTRENNLNKVIVDSIKKYLIQADIPGLYKHHLDNIDDILSSLYFIKSNIKAFKNPGTPTFCTLLQQYSITSLFSNYSSMIVRDLMAVECQ